MGSSSAPRAAARRRDPGHRPGLRHERRVLRLALFSAVPAVAVAGWLLWAEPHSLKVRITFTVLVVVVWLGSAFLLREYVVHPLQTVSNLLAALREGDYSVRARGAGEEDALGLTLLEVNTLGETLRSQRLSALEATALLRRVMEEIDAAVFTFDEERRLRLVNRGGERLLGRPAERLLGRTADDLGLATCLNGDSPRAMEVAFAGGSGRWEARRRIFRQDGRPHELLVLTDLSRTLRAEERLAWQRLVRVLGHEINNSLAPIKSIAGSLHTLLARPERPSDWEEDLRGGLAVIAGRSESLGRFMAAYAKLARLPKPTPSLVLVDDWVRRVAALASGAPDARVEVRIVGGPAVAVRADPDQLEQLLINLVKNAVDAAITTGGGVELSWRVEHRFVELCVDDDGPGPPESANLFVPFFTTKPEGSGIGLALSRQIAEAHGGSVTLKARAGRPGATATVRLPVADGSAG